MRLIYESERGSIVLGKDADMRITEADGLGFLPKTRNMSGRAGVDGQYCMGEYVGARTITVSGDFLDSDDFIEKRAVRVLGADGTLIVGSRCIGAVCTLFEVSKKGAGYKSFILQLSADYPYFKDKTPKINVITETTRLLKTQFVLPKVFSTRYSRREVYNGGDTVCEPILELTALANGEGSVVFEIEPSGKRIVLDYAMKRGEKVVADIENRAVTSDINGSILNALTADSYLSDFVLERGSNVISVTNGIGTELTVICRHKNQYADAIT